MTKDLAEKFINLIELIVKAEVHPRNINHAKVSRAKQDLLSSCNAKPEDAQSAKKKTWTNGDKIKAAMDSGMRWDIEDPEVTNSVINFFDYVVELSTE